ncbi:MAG: CoA pyrophosphatase [Eubacterium sp.]|nr:CoA pyrophosphatase [Eubacterium sp.]
MTNQNQKILPREQKIRDSFSAHKPCYPEYAMTQTAAVLIPILEVDGELQLLFEIRAASLHAQPGEICFPGGRLEAGENPVQAARRETVEELLVEEHQIEMIGQMDGVMGPAGAPVWPVAGFLHDYKNTWSADEVDHTILVPLGWFQKNKPETYEAQVITKPAEDFPFDLIPGGRDYPWRRKKHLVYFYRTPAGIIWGMTGHVVASFISRYAGTDIPDYLPEEKLNQCI